MDNGAVAVDDNVSIQSRASETYHEVKDLLHGIIRSSQAASNSPQNGQLLNAADPFN